MPSCFSPGSPTARTKSGVWNGWSSTCSVAFTFSTFLARLGPSNSFQRSFARSRRSPLNSDVRRLYSPVAMPLFGHSVPSRSARVWFSAHAAVRIFSRSLLFSALSCSTIQLSCWLHGVSRHPLRLPRIVQWVHWSIVLSPVQKSALVARRRTNHSSGLRARNARSR
jgi:hypothetical protein